MSFGQLDQQLQAEIIQFCQSQGNVGYSRRVVHFKQFAIKYGQVTLKEANNQHHAHTLLDETFDRVPKVHAYFTDNGINYLMTDHIDGEIRAVVEDEKSLAAIARLVSHLHTFTSTNPGPVNGGDYSGSLWPEGERTPRIDYATDLEGYVNSRLLGGREISFSATPFVFVHGDLAPRNIVFGRDGLWLLDWESAGFFPRAVEFAGLRHDCAGGPADLMFRDRLEKKLEMLSPLKVNEHEQIELLLLYSFNCIRYSWDNTKPRSASAKKPRRPVRTTEPVQEQPWLDVIAQAGLSTAAHHCPHHNFNSRSEPSNYSFCLV